MEEFEIIQFLRACERGGWGEIKILEEGRLELGEIGAGVGDFEQNLHIPLWITRIGVAVAWRDWQMEKVRVYTVNVM